MLRFPIHLKRNDFSFNADGKSLETTVKLNDEFQIIYVWKDQQYHPILNSIKICRENTFHEVLVSGTLAHALQWHTGSYHEFVKLMEVGTCFTTIDFSDPKFLVIRQMNVPSYIVLGNIYITINKDECEKCADQKSMIQLSNDFEQLLDPQNLCSPDVNLKCGDDIIPVHKLILSARSPVFASMFANEMKENIENEVNITDIDASAVRDMITYIYTGKTSSLTESSASELLFAADKYQLDYLKKLCCDFMQKNVTNQNVLRILVLGDLHSEDLKCFAVDYICKKCNFNEFESLEEWKSLKKQRADLAIEVLTAVVKSRDPQVINNSEPNL